jgi:hypothetical protein
MGRKFDYFYHLVHVTGLSLSQSDGIKHGMNVANCHFKISNYQKVLFTLYVLPAFVKSFIDKVFKSRKRMWLLN